MERLTRQCLRRFVFTAFLTLGGLLTTAFCPSAQAAEASLGPRLGLALPHAKGFGFNPLATASLDIRIPHERSFFELGVGGLAPIRSNHNGRRAYWGAFLEAGAGYYLMDEDVSPYVGAGIVPRVLSSSSLFNLAGYGQLGVNFGRTWATRFHVDVRLTQSLTRLDLYDYDLDDESELETRAWPLEGSLNLGIAW